MIKRTFGGSDGLQKSCYINKYLFDFKVYIVLFGYLKVSKTYCNLKLSKDIAI